MKLSKENENHLEEKEMKKYSEILEVISSTEFAVKNSIVTKEVIDEWDSQASIDQFDIEYDVEITEDEWADFCERYDRVARQVEVIKHLIEECGDDDEI